MDFAREVIARALEEALRRVKPAAGGASERGISGEWALYSWGWWPLVVHNEFIHRSRYAPVVKCVSSDCNHIVPPGPRKGRSQRCEEREKKRRPSG